MAEDISSKIINLRKKIDKWQEELSKLENLCPHLFRQLKSSELADKWMSGERAISLLEFLCL